MNTRGLLAALLFLVGGFLLPVHAAVTPLDDLQLDTVPVTRLTPGSQDKPMIIFFTGDGGWAELDKRVSANFMRQGIPVVALSSLTYFWHFKSPEQTTQDLQRILHYYTRQWQRSRVILIGYSFGAEIIPFVINRLPTEYHNMIAGGVMLVPSTSSDFEIHMSDWVSSGNMGKYPTRPEVAKIDDIPLQCIYSELGDDDLCPLLQGQKNVTLTQLSGGHNFGKHYSLLTNEILKVMSDVIAPQKTQRAGQ